jgi:hypothetical protein
MTQINNNATNVVAPTPRKGSKIRHPKQQLRVMKRRAKIVAGRWAEDVTDISVRCRACKQTKKLDGRGDAAYYAGNWKKHLKTCDSIKVELAKVIIV